MCIGLAAVDNTRYGLGRAPTRRLAPASLWQHGCNDGADALRTLILQER